jgi:hypothetical protein
MRVAVLPDPGIMLRRYDRGNPMPGQYFIHLPPVIPSVGDAVIYGLSLGCGFYQ